MKTFKTGAILEKLSTLKDGSIKVIFETQEIQPEEASLLFERVGKFSWLIVSGEAQAEIELPDEPPPEFKSDKTPSQRQRNLLYVWWNKLKPKEDFETFRNIKMNAIEGWIKNKIEEI